MDDFSKPKIVWGELSDRAKFMLDEKGDFFISNTAFLMTGGSLKWIISFLNSPLSEYLFSTICSTSGVGTIRWLKFTIEQLLIPPPELSETDFSLRFNRDYSQLNQRIYKILGLTQEEIAFVENHINKS